MSLFKKNTPKKPFASAQREREQGEQSGFASCEPQRAYKKEMKIVPDERDGALAYASEVRRDPFLEDAAPQPQGQLSVDVFQTADEIVILAPAAGTKSADLHITLTEGVLTIQGRRSFQFNIEAADYYTRECFWGDFSRSVILPEDGIDAGRVSASFKNGLLTVRVPKVEKVKTRRVEIREEE